MKLLGFFVLFLLWIFVFWIFIDNFSLNSLLNFIFFSYWLLSTLNIVEYKKLSIKHLIIWFILWILISIISYIWILHWNIIYLIISFILCIILWVSYPVRYKQNYLIKKIDNFINDDIEVQNEFLEINKLIDYFNEKIVKDEIMEKFNTENENTFKLNFKKYKYFYIKMSLNMLITKWINTEVYSLVNYLDNKYLNTLSIEETDMINSHILNLSMWINYTETLTEFYKFMLFWNDIMDDIKRKNIVDFIWFCASYYKNNILLRTQKKNMDIFFKWIWNMKIVV